MVNIVLKNIKIGDKFRIVGNRLQTQGYYEFAPGTIVQVVYRGGTSIQITQIPNSAGYTGRQASIVLSDLSPLSISKEDLQKELLKLEEQKEDIQNKIDWITETGSEEYDETEVKVWTTLKTLDDKKLSPLEKSKLIAKLIKEG